jgi:hypothetical protein
MESVFQPSIFDQLQLEHMYDLAGTREMLKEIVKDKVQEVFDINPESYNNCLNCHVKFNPNPTFIELYGVHCSPNCALRRNLDSFINGEIHGRIYQYIIDKIEKFFDLDGIEPFPVFETFRGSIQEYHAQKPLPPGFRIDYTNRTDEREEDTMEI